MTDARPHDPSSPGTAHRADKARAGVAAPRSDTSGDLPPPASRSRLRSPWFAPALALLAGLGVTVALAWWLADPARSGAGGIAPAIIVLVIGTLASILFSLVVRLRSQGAGRSLHASEERWRLALKAIDAIVYDWDVDADRALRSSGLLSVLGYSPGELAPTLQGWLDLVHPDDRTLVAGRFDQVRHSGDLFGVEYRVRHKDGRYIHVRDRGVIVRDAAGRPVRVVGCTVSRESRVRAERQVEVANERFELFAEAVNDVLWMMDLEPLRVVYVNPAFERVWGVTPEVVYADPLAWLDPVHLEDRDRVLEAARAWHAGEGPGKLRIGYRIRRPDGEVRWIQDTGIRLDDAQGRPYRVVGVAEDITDRKLAQIDLEESERAYRQLFDSSLAVKIVFEPAGGRIVQANAAAVKFYGYSQQALESMTVFDLCACEPEEVRQKLIGGLDSVPRMDSRHRLASGEIREVEIFSSNIQLRGRALVYSLILDITERKRVEAALQESRRTLEQAQVVGRIGSWVSDASPDGRLLWSSQVFRIFGLEPGAFDQQISTFFRLVHPDDLEGVRAATTTAIREHSVYRIDHRIIRPDGEVRWVHEQGEVEYDPSGAPLRIIGVVQDITERKNAERALRDKEEHLRTILEVLAEGCVVLTPDGVCVECNAAAEYILGVPRSRMIGAAVNEDQWTIYREDGSLSPVSEFPSEISRHTGQAIDGAIQGFTRPSGEVRWLSINTRPLRTSAGQMVGVVVSFADITDRRAAAHTLQETAHKYQLLFDANPEPLWVYDTGSLRFLAVNRAAVENYGYSQEEFLAMTILDIRPPAEHQKVLDRIAGMVENDRLRSTWVHRVKDGRIIDVEIISHAIEFEGRPARIVLAKDITERLRAEQALRESERNLRDAQRIGEFGDWEYELESGRIAWSEQVFRLFRRNPAAGPPEFEENMSYYFPEDRARLMQAVHDAAEIGKESDLDLHLLLPTGEDVWHRGIVNVVRDSSGKVVRLKGVVQDITARKHAELALRATQLRLATILEHLPDVAVYEADRARIFPSDNILSLVGYPAAVFEKDRAAFIRLIHPADFDEANARIEGLRANPRSDALVIQYRLRHRDGHYIWVEDRMIFQHPDDGDARLLGVLLDISERKRAEQQQRLMMAELDHRVKNNLATVISLLEQTARTARTVQEFQQTFLGRLQALARMHKALSRTHWEGVRLRALVTQTLEAYQSNPPGRVEIIGKDLTLPARAASPVAMALHELATNAVKYGSLSVPDGRVRVEWTVEEEPNGPGRILLRWTELDGPPVVTPSSPGFGTELIQGGIAYELHGEAHIEFNPRGVCCSMTIPLAIAPPATFPAVEAN